MFSSAPIKSFFATGGASGSWFLTTSGVTDPCTDTSTDGTNGDGFPSTFSIPYPCATMLCKIKYVKNPMY